MCAIAVQRSSAEAVLKELQLQPDAWTKVDTILEGSTTEQTKFFALQVHLQTCIDMCVLLAAVDQQS